MSCPVIDSMSLRKMVALFHICTTLNGDDGKRLRSNKLLQATSLNTPRLRDDVDLRSTICYPMHNYSQAGFLKNTIRILENG
jgi:hypothetical protein